MIRSFVTALLLVTLPLAQARAVVVCAMNDMPAAVEPNDCVCPHAHHANHAPLHEDRGHEDTGHGDCCTVEFSPADTSGALLTASTDDRSRLATPHDESSTPVALPATFDAIVATARAVPRPPTVDSFEPDGSLRFLLTGRLRL